jgi:chemotaxis protein MotB
MSEKKQKCPIGAPMWMTTFSDIVLLLLTFFVLLLSMANMDPVKVLKAQQSLKDAFGWRQESPSTKLKIPVLPSPPIGKLTPIPRETATKYYKQIKTDLELSKISQQVEVLKKDNDTIILRLNDSVLFAPGKAILGPASYPLLRKVADIVRPLPMLMRIEGHTDNIPFIRDGLDNWELSVDRGVAVMRFYNKGKLFPLDRMSAIGYGETRPIVPNISAENKAKNRRVDFVLRSNVTPRQGAGVRPIIPF